LLPLISCRSVPPNGRSNPTRSGPLQRRTLLAAVAIVAVAATGLGWESAHAAKVVKRQGDAQTGQAAAEDNAFYRCLAVQAHSLVAPGEPVLDASLAGAPLNLAEYIALFKATGGWVTVASSRADAVGLLDVIQVAPGPGTCRGFVVVLETRDHDGHAVIRRGSGASVGGTGFPPPTPL